MVGHNLEFASKYVVIEFPYCKMIAKAFRSMCAYFCSASDNERDTYATGRS